MAIGVGISWKFWLELSQEWFKQECDQLQAKLVESADFAMNTRHCRHVVMTGLNKHVISFKLSE